MTIINHRTSSSNSFVVSYRPGLENRKRKGYCQPDEYASSMALSPTPSNDSTHDEPITPVHKKRKGVGTHSVGRYRS